MQKIIRVVRVCVRISCRADGGVKEVDLVFVVVAVTHAANGDTGGNRAAGCRVVGGNTCGTRYRGVTDRIQASDVLFRIVIAIGAAGIAVGHVGAIAVTSVVFTTAGVTRGETRRVLHGEEGMHDAGKFDDAHDHQ